MRSLLSALAVMIAVSFAATPAIAGKRVTVGAITLEAPAGWKLTKQPDGGAKLVNPTGDIAWRFFAAEPATDLDAWFDAAWKVIAAAHTDVQASPAETTPTKTGLNGRATAGLITDARGTVHIVMVAAFSDGKRVAPMVIEFANQDALGKLTDLSAASDTIKLVAKSAKPKQAFAAGGWRYPISGAALSAVAAKTPPATAPPTAPAPPTTAPAPPAADAKNQPFLGKWGVGSSARSADSSVSYGSRIYQYDFAANGTYRYHSEAWGGTFASNWRYIIDEKGTWTASGDQLTVTATEVTGVVRDLAGKIQKRGGPALEKVTYKFQTTYFSGLQETQLVLTPPKQTARDGAFAVNASFPNSYLLSTTYQPGFKFAPQ